MKEHICNAEAVITYCKDCDTFFAIDKADEDEKELDITKEDFMKFIMERWH